MGSGPVRTGRRFRELVADDGFESDDPTWPAADQPPGKEGRKQAERVRDGDRDGT
jgi:hypothetical protein